MKKELRRLRFTNALIDSNFAYFGVNKKQEIVRLLYEISKRAGISPAKIIKDTHPLALKNSDISIQRDFAKIKNYLLRLRYPHASSQSASLRPYLPKIDLGNSWLCNLKKSKFYPKNIFIEKAATHSFLAKRFRSLFPKARFSGIQSLSAYLSTHRKFSIEVYNKRKDTIFIVNENHDFFKKCPCTKGAYGCGYHIFNLGFGCIFECTYCYLQGYTNNPGIILPANIDQFFIRFAAYKKRGMRIGTGEFSDSLALDKITEFSPEIVDFFKKRRDLTFEFKTKSSNIENLLKIESAGNVVISWSLNPQRIIEKNEYFSASLKERLEAAQRCAQAGYRVGFHFDPVIYCNHWQDEYRALIELLFDKIKAKQIAWISIGTFRFSPNLKQVIERRFPANKILDQELLLGYDRKLRYPYALRYKIYKAVIEMLSKHDKRLKLYLCMEKASMWKDLKLRNFLAYNFV